MFVPDIEGKFNFTGLHTEAEDVATADIGKGGTIWLGRHGEVHNPNAIFYGRLPRFHLSEIGRQQTLATGRFLAEQPLVAAFSSPLLRARQTASTYLTFHPELKLQISALLLEVRTQYQGRLQSEMGDFNFYEPMADPNDETLDMVLTRVLAFFKRTLARYKGQQVLAVSHGDPVAVTHAHYVGLPIRLASLRRPNMYPQLASLTRYDFPPEGFTANFKRVRVSYYEPAHPTT